MLSMTGYGRGVAQRDGRQVSFELKSVNHRFLDLSFRLPRAMLFLEDELRRQIGGALSRGHVEIYANYRNVRKDARCVQVDEGLVDAYLAALGSLSARGVPGEVSVMSLAGLPDVLTVTEGEDDPEEIRALAREALDASLLQMVSMRRAEGENLARDLARKVDEIERITREIEARYPETVEDYKTRLRRAVSDLAASDIDPARLSLEVALMADRSAIAEETVRLFSHISQIRETLLLSEPIGRKLDFLVQELNREANTISSKSQDIPITRSIVALKAEIEKLREQLQNVE